MSGKSFESPKIEQNQQDQKDKASKKGFQLAQPQTLAGYLANRKTKAALTFAGQGFLGFKQLQEHFESSSTVKKLVSIATKELEAFVKTPEARYSGLYTHGFSLMDWVQSPEKKPSDSVLSSCVYSQALIFLTQVASFHIALRDGLAEAWKAKSITVTTGHSQGVMPALFVAEMSGTEINFERFASYIRYMAWQGYFMAQADRATGRPMDSRSPMVAVSGLDSQVLSLILKKLNHHLATPHPISISLYNTRSRHVLSGLPSSLSLLKDELDALSIKQKKQKKKGQFAGKALSFTWEPLPVGGPYHSSYMASGIEPMLEKQKELGFTITADLLHCDVLSPADGTLYNTHEELFIKLVKDQFVRSVQWPATLQKIAGYDIQQVLDLGPGDGVSRLTRSALKGHGLQVYALATAQGKEQLYTEEYHIHAQEIRYADWKPKTKKDTHGNAYIENAYTKATGQFPYILGGMTPTTSEVPIVAAAANAGFTAELAGGGQVSEKIFWLRMEELKKSLKPGSEVVFNGLYLDPYLWDLHVRKTGLVQKARKAGYPLSGVTISAGIPEQEEAVKLLRQLQSVGLWHNAFKPGTAAQVKRIIKIAQAVPEYNLFMHLEGGKAGGHHTWEALDEILLETYHLLRSQPNIILCVGGGIGSPSKASAYLHGDWSTAYGMLEMPVDAVILGTVTMACLEAKTSPQVKQALVDAAGLDEWVYSGKQTAGMTSGKSQLNADIYYLENAASRCGRLLDQVAGDAKKVQAQRKEIIDALNLTAKPFFGEIEQMTYLQVAKRMVELMAIGKNDRYEDGIWPDITYRQRFADFIWRAEARLVKQEKGSFESLFSSFEEFSKPKQILKDLEQGHPSSAKEKLHPMDQDFFLQQICARPGKPVNFVPVINADVRKWYKADSLWQAHDARYEAEQVLVIPGPEAIKGLVKKDEPVASLFSRFAMHLQEQLSNQKPNGQAEEKTTQSSKTNFPQGFLGEYSQNEVTLYASEDFKSSGWLEYIKNNFDGSVSKLFENSRLFQEQGSVANPFVQVCKVQADSSFELRFDDKNQLNKFTFSLGKKVQESLCIEDLKAEAQLSIQYIIPSVDPEQAASSYSFKLRYEEKQGNTKFFIDSNTQKQAFRKFYYSALFGKELVPVEGFEQASTQASISLDRSRAYNLLTGGQHQSNGIPLNAAFSLVWEPLFQLLSADEFIGELLNLVHLENKIEKHVGWPIQAEEEVTVTSQITRLENLEAGRKIHTESSIYRKEQLCAKVSSAFYIQGSFADREFQIQADEKLEQNITLQNQSELAFLQAQSWLQIDKTSEVSFPLKVRFDLTLTEKQNRQGQSTYTTQGQAFFEGKSISVEHSEQGKSSVHPVRSTLAQLQSDDNQYSLSSRTLAKENVTSPLSMDNFAEISRDRNPLHTSQLIASLAGFEQPIVHGMWTAARLHQFLLHRVLKGNSSKIQSYQASFLAPLDRGEEFECKAIRQSLENGKMVIGLTATTIKSKQVVVQAKAIIALPKVAYIFPGQGIQQVHMGMTGFSRSKAAKQVWLEADAYTRNEIGFSILQVVRENPKELLIKGTRYRHPRGVIDLTQFTQVAMAVLAQAQVAELKEAGLFQEEAVICGHSVGEYNAIAVSGILKLETVIELVYQRGLAMHRLVARDESGESGYRMAVIRPHYAGLTHKSAEELVEQIRKQSKSFIQIVNYNVKGRQYSVTGKQVALKLLEQELAKRAISKKAAYIEIPGIDVPFHSSELVNGVENFRKTLTKRLPTSVNHKRLLGRYIPNLVPKPFSLEKEYIQEVSDYTDSYVLKDVLKQFEKHQKKPQQLARILLIELLAWQFASPVRWIETQDLLMLPKKLGGMGLERVIEIGVGYQPTLANMARYTQKLLGVAALDVEIMNIEAESQIVFYQDNDPAEAPVEEAPQTKEPQKTASIVKTQPVSVAPVGQASAAPIEDRPFSVEQALKALLAIQAKVRSEQLLVDETIDELFDGVSSRRNQVLLDLGAEFEIGPIDGAHEKKLQLLTQELMQRSGNYSKPGKYLRTAQDEMFKKLFSRAGMGKKEVNDYLQSEYNLGTGLSDSTLITLTLESRSGNSGRGGDLGQLGTDSPASRDEAKQAIDKAVSILAASLGVQIAKVQTGSAQGGAAVDARVVQELEDKIMGKNGILMQTARQIARSLEQPLDVTGKTLSTVDQNAEAVALYEAEHGKGYIKGIAPRFDAQKHVAFSSAWATAQSEIARLYHNAIEQELPIEALQQKAYQLSQFAGDKRSSQTARWFASQAKAKSPLSQIFNDIAEGKTKAPFQVELSRPHLELKEDGNFEYFEKVSANESSFSSFTSALWPKDKAARMQIGEQGYWDKAFQKELEKHSQERFDFSGKTILVTGASPNSIAESCVRFFLRGSARVLVTTTSYHAKRIRFYRELYEQEATPGAELHIVPFNQASFQDVEELVEWIFSTVTEQVGPESKTIKPSFYPDIVMPFAAPKDLATLDQVGSQSNVVIRAMLLGVERLITSIASRYMKLGKPEKPCHVILPLSPNHGSFGGDGVYAESKAALEVLLQKWHSEHEQWAQMLTFCAAKIGWVRGTGLMDANNQVAVQLEEQTGLRTFSNQEMGFMLTTLCTDTARIQAEKQPLKADLTGGFTAVENLKETVDGIRDDLLEQSKQKQVLSKMLEQNQQSKESTKSLKALPNWPHREPSLNESQEHLSAWPQASVGLEQSIVIVGSGELGPCGSSRTRFELEIGEDLSPAGVLELAWMTGLITYETKGRKAHWKDIETDKEIDENEIFEKYHDQVRSRVGLRFIVPETAGFNPDTASVWSCIYLEKDLTFPVSSEEEARTFVSVAPDSTHAFYDQDQETWKVTRQAGTEIRVPKQVRLKRNVAGFMPDGFSFERFGITQDMIENIDRVTLINLVATVDAFLNAGLTPEELLSWIHPARVANTQGSGIGGMRSLQRLYTDHILGQDRQKDILQETLINVVAAYIVQSYVGSYGSMSHPVAACATAAVSLEEGMDKILAGKADFVVTGGYDDIGEEGVLGFRDMAATADTDLMAKMGFEPHQMSRANDVRRKGFVEAQGGGTILLARGDIALKLGLPVQGVLGYAASFGDGIHKSIPAPGLGALACASGGVESPLHQALEQYGLSTDDIAVVYKHDTSTNANDPNENELHQRIQETLGRSLGNPLFVVSQKMLTGHPKGGAAAWQTIGLCQTLQSGKVSGNRNLDCVDPKMRPFFHLTFLNKTLKTHSSQPLKAGLLTSLGFGHVSGVALILHPNSFLSLLSDEQRLDYLERASIRKEKERTDRTKLQMGKKQLYEKRNERRFHAADGTPCQAKEEAKMLLSQAARLDPETNRFKA